MYQVAGRPRTNPKTGMTFVGLATAGPMPRHDDRTLAESLANGDLRALAELYDRYSSVVYRVALGFTVSADQAEDVVQEVFLHLGERAGSYGGKGTFEGWIRQLAARAALGVIRTERRRRGLLARHHSESASSSAQDGTCSRIDAEKLLARLPPKLRSVVVLKELEQCSHREVATTLGISVSASKVRLHRAMRKLREDVHDWEEA